MFNSVLQTLISETSPFSLFDVLTQLFVSFGIGFWISWLYRKTYKGFGYSATFVNMLIVITMITAMVIMVIGSNLARAFGLVGAMSIIRFRTALKDTKDITFVFFALASGLAIGSGNYGIGIIGSLLIGIAIWILMQFRYGIVAYKELMLRFWVLPTSEKETPIYLPIFKKFLTSYTLLNVQPARLGEFLELCFFVRLKDPDQSQLFVRELSSLKGVDRVSLVVGEEQEGS